jgi:hypothetical protein
MITAHNKYINDYKLINLSGFRDDGSVLMGNINRGKDMIDYSKYTCNEFICTNYTIEGPENPIFVSVMGPFLGTRLFISPAKLECAGKRLVEHLRSDMMRFMTEDTAKAILVDYQEYGNKARATAPWAATWFEKQIITTQNKEDLEHQEEPQGKRKKTVTTTNQRSLKDDQSNTHHAHKQQATKVLSEATMTNEEKRMAMLEKLVAELQNEKVELLTTIGEMRDNQHQDQTQLLGLETQLEATN